MKIKQIILSVALAGLSVAQVLAQGLTSYVNPFIGTGGHGHTFPGATVPFGMVQVSPDTRNRGWDWASGYHDQDTSMIGFSHLHISGTGVGDLGDILLMPTNGKLKVIPGDRKVAGSGYRSLFSHKDEKASPGYYSVMLKDYGIKAELTATKRAGFQRYTFPQSAESHIIIDLEHGIGDREKINEGSLKFENDSTISGYRRSNGWAKDQIVYFVMVFSKPFQSFGIASGDSIQMGKKAETAKIVRAFVNYSTSANEVVMVKTGISAVSVDGARQNLKAEIPGWNFKGTVAAAEAAWDKELAKIKLETSNKKHREIFYTALYHTYLAPSLYSDIDGQYRGQDGNVHTAKGFDNYSTFSLWDTFRTLHPLFTFVQKERVNDMIKAMLAHYDESGMLPVWPLQANETWCMIGYHSVPVIVDAYMKGIRGYDVEKAYKAIKTSAMADHKGLEHYKKMGYIPSDKEKESVSKTLEYAYDDWCIAQMAKALGKTDDYKLFMERAGHYKNLFDKRTGFIRAKTSDGNWREPFDPQFTAYGKDYTEGNAWQYSWFVPQDVQGLVNQFGSKARFTTKLDSVFTVQADLSKNSTHDVTGMVGEYAHGNEPSHHILYLYNYVGQPWKTQERAREMLTVMYDNKPDGYSGNEDCGQMSAWYILSALGFYPVNPAEGVYTFGSPMFEKATIALGKGKQLIVTAKNVSEQNKYIQSVSLNGKPLNKTWFRHADVANGGTLSFVMGNKPNKAWGAAPSAYPPSMTPVELKK